ncbi:MAG: YdcF family protein [Rhodocyclaceae bacterium]|nr:YdcF family protein [Rhodocyclaceae bacterium]
MDAWFAKKLLAAMVLPPVGPLLLIFLGIVLVRGWPRAGRLLATLGFLALCGLSMPYVASSLVQILGKDQPLDLIGPIDAQAIVVMGGGVRPQAPEYGGDTLGRLTLERVRYGALVARKTGLPVLVTGGSVSDTTPEAVLMKRSLEEEFGISVRWSEPRSRNTHENAVFSAAILEEAGVSRIILVAHSFDMRRAKAEFMDAGLDVIPAATGIPGNNPSQLTDWIPTVPALQTSYWALYEMLANAARSL